MGTNKESRFTSSFAFAVFPLDGPFDCSAMAIISASIRGYAKRAKNVAEVQYVSIAEDDQIAKIVVASQICEHQRRQSQCKKCGGQV